MERDDIGEFLKKMTKDSQEPKTQDNQKPTWLDLIRPTTVSLILGAKGTGKSAEAYYLVEQCAKAFSLMPVVVNLPREKQILLPESFTIKSLEELKHTQDTVALVDEGTTMIPAGGRKLEELVKSFVALSRQRNQIIIFVFHSSSDVGSRILRGVDTILLKEPSQRQIQFGSKDHFCRIILTEAKEKFNSLRDMGEDPRRYTYVDCERPAFRGMLKNDLPSFWTEDLSKAWADTSEDVLSLFGKLLGKPAMRELTTEERLARWGVPPELWGQVIQMDYDHSQEELEEMCRQRGLPTSGEKKKLASSLILQQDKESGGESNA